VLKRLILILFILLSTASCGFGKDHIAVVSLPKNCQIDINIGNDDFKYKLLYNNNRFAYFPYTDSPPICAVVDDGVFNTVCNDINFKFPETPIVPLPLEIAIALRSCIGKEVSINPQGDFKLYGNVNGREYVIDVTSEGFPLTLLIESRNLYVRFN